METAEVIIIRVRGLGPEVRSQRAPPAILPTNIPIPPAEITKAALAALTPWLCNGNHFSFYSAQDLSL